MSSKRYFKLGPKAHSFNDPKSGLSIANAMVGEIDATKASTSKTLEAGLASGHIIEVKEEDYKNYKKGITTNPTEVVEDTDTDDVEDEETDDVEEEEEEEEDEEKKMEELLEKINESNISKKKKKEAKSLSSLEDLKAFMEENDIE